VNALNISPANYNSGGSNTFLVVAGVGNEGLSSNPSWSGAYARVTVYAVAP
jgi:hypothetical protein